MRFPILIPVPGIVSLPLQILLPVAYNLSNETQLLIWKTKLNTADCNYITFMGTSEHYHSLVTWIVITPHGLGVKSENNKVVHYTGHTIQDEQHLASNAFLWNTPTNVTKSLNFKFDTGAKLLFMTQN